MKSLKFDFTNDRDEVLSGRLELPHTKPRAFAIFAHCFTCSKNLLAASRISKKLTDSGIGVLRFDFTGLGNSEGDFANTNFSSNIQDLISAFEALKKEYKAPEILIGHSLGGAAVLKAQSLLEEVKCVVTLGAPSDTHHVSHLFKDDLPVIDSEGEAIVNLQGRKFKIKKQFLEDIKEQEILESLKKSKKAFLIMHSPIDNTVSIDHAAKIYSSLKHPKSFFSLDDADHLIMNPDHAEYAADIIGAWVKKYISSSENIPRDFNGDVLVQSRAKHQYTHDIYTKDHVWVADEPKKVEGDNLGPNPYELLLSSLGACTAMTIKMYAKRKGIHIEEVKVDLNHKKEHFEHCNTCEEGAQILDVIRKKITISGDFTQEQHKRLLEIAEKCPVNKTLQSEIKISSIDSLE